MRSRYFCSTNQVKKMKMKKLLSIILAALCLSLTYSSADNNQSTQSQKPIKIYLGTLTDRIERTSQYVEALLDTNVGIIEVEYYGLGDGEIFIVNTSNEVVDSIQILSEVGHAVLNAPIDEGNYTLVVSCCSCYGEGFFTIE